MPSGIYKRTEEIKKNISKAMEGKIPWNKNKHLSEEHKRNISKSNKGKILSKETRKKMSKVAKEKGFGLWMKGKHISEEIRRKIGEANKGNSWNKGKYLSEETKKKIGEANKGRIISEEHKKIISKAHKGTKNHFWQGGKSFEEYTVNFNRELKELVRQRDNYQCQLCGMPEVENIRKLCIHHVDYNKKNCLPSNLISLCTSCHIRTNFNRDYWIEYLLNKRGLNVYHI